MNRIRSLAEIVGFFTLALLALYGLLALCGAAGPSGLAVLADAHAPAAVAEEAAILGGDIPQTMNYQGFLRNPDGSLATGSYTITARIWSSPTLGTKLYETTVPNVTVRDGLFNIVLGDDPPLPAEAFSDAPRYIGIDLNDGAGELIPRQRLHAVPWALTATTLVDGANVQGLSSTGDITLTTGSDVIVEGGDINATGNLNVSDDLAVGGDLDATGNLTVTGGFGITRTYKIFWFQHFRGTDTPPPKHLGNWDLCALASYEIAGPDEYIDDWGQCLVYPDFSGGGWGDHPDPGYHRLGPGVREAWFMFANLNDNTDKVQCQAICVNFGE